MVVDFTVAIGSRERPGRIPAAHGTSTKDQGRSQRLKRAAGIARPRTSLTKPLQCRRFFYVEARSLIVSDAACNNALRWKMCRSVRGRMWEGVVRSRAEQASMHVPGQYPGPSHRNLILTQTWSTTDLLPVPKSLIAQTFVCLCIPKWQGRVETKH